jgi:hypothetical protein
MCIMHIFLCIKVEKNLVHMDLNTQKGIAKF